MTTISESDGAADAAYADHVGALCQARSRLHFDPYVDIDWDAPENAVDRDDPRWQLDPLIAPLAATDWYAQQPLQQRIDMGRWLTANMLKVTLQFEMMLVRGVIHYADKQPNGSVLSRYLISEIADECNHIQMFQEFVNRSGEDVPGMRRVSRIFGPIISVIGGYANVFLFIGVICGEQPLHFQQTLQHRGATEVPPLLNKVTYIHLAEEARHISFADVHLAKRVQEAGPLRRALYTIVFPLFLRWLIGEMITPRRAFVGQFDIPRRVVKDAYWRNPRSRQLLAESAADVRRVAEDLGLRPFWSLWIWVVLGIDGRIPRYRSEPDRSSVRPRPARRWPLFRRRAKASAHPTQSLPPQASSERHDMTLFSDSHTTHQHRSAVELPYFDLLMDERQDGGEIGQLWENQVHWGYWEDPKSATGTRADYIAAMEQMNTVLLRAARVDDGLTLLDAGCGFGGTIGQLNAAHTNMNITGLNIDARQLAAADAQITPTNGNEIDWVEADACQLPFEANTFDRVMAVECIFHFPSREKFLAEAARVLKPGGYLAVSDFVPTLSFFGKTPVWMAIRPQVAKSYGTLGDVPLRGYKAMGRRAGLELVADRNIRKNTLPTYPFLLKFFREQGTAEAQETMMVGTRWMKWLTEVGLLQYRVYTFRKPA